MNGCAASWNVPDHTLVRLIGRGAYGEVWLARNVMGVCRAVKIVARNQFESDRPYEREFAGIQRYEPLSRSADGLVHVLHVGRNDDAGYFFYVMELADPSAGAGSMGRSPDTDLPDAAYEPRTLRSDLRRLGGLPLSDCLRLGLDIVGGLIRLHERGLVHRDVKPGNIIYVEGRAKLADVGLVSTGGEGRTFVGTEGYIPPEGPGTDAADLFALGMVLYEAVTGFSPDQFPRVPPEWFRDEISTEVLEFQEIVLKACEGAKDRRYRSAQEMQADLALLQSGQSVRQLHAMERRVRRWTRLGWAAACALAALMGVALFSDWRARVEADGREKETKLRERTEAALRTALFEQARALVLSRELGHRTRALDALKRAKGANAQPAMRQVAFAALSVPDLRLEHEIPIDSRTTLVSPDPAMGRIALCSGAGPVVLRRIPDFSELAVLRGDTNRHAYVGVWHSSGEYLAVKRQYDGFGVRSDWEVWDVPRTQHILTLGPDGARNAFAFHPHRRIAMVGHLEGRCGEWDLENGQVLREFRLSGAPSTLSYSPDGRWIVAIHSAGPAWRLSILSAKDLQVERTMDWPSPSWLSSWHPQGRWFTTIDDQSSAHGRGIFLIDPSTGMVSRLGEHKIKTAMGAFTGDGNYLISSGWDRELFCWDLRTTQKMFTCAGTAYRHYWSLDGKQCVLWLPESALQLFQFERPGYQHLADNPGDALRDGQFSLDGRWLAARDDRHLCVWDVRSEGPPLILPTPRRQTAFFSPDCSELFAVPEEYSQQGFLERWRLEASIAPGQPPTATPLPVELPQRLLRAAFAGDSLLLTSPEGVRFVARTNLASGEGRIVKVPAGLGYVSPDARWMAVTYEYNPWIRVYRLPEVQEVALLKTGDVVTFVTFSPQSDELLVLNRSGAEWYDASSWRQSRRLPGAPVSGSYAFYTPDGVGIWMVTHFRNAALLDRRTLEPLLPLPNNVLPLAVTGDGRRLAVSVEGKRVQLWDMPELKKQLASLGLAWEPE